MFDWRNVFDGLLKRAYLISFIAILSLIFLLCFVFFIKINKIEYELQDSNLQYTMSISNKFELIQARLLQYFKNGKLEQNNMSYIKKETAVESIYLIDNDANIVSSFSDFKYEPSKLQIYGYKDELKKYRIYVSEFTYLNGKPIVFMISPYKENLNILCVIDMNKIIDKEYSNRFIVDSKGFVVPGKKGDNIYDTFAIDFDWKNNDSIKISKNAKTGNFNFYSISYDKFLNLGIVSRVSFYKIFELYSDFNTAIIIVLIFIILISIDNLKFIKTHIIASVKNLEKLLNGLKTGEMPTAKIEENGIFGEISKDMLNIYSNEVVARHDLANYEEQYSTLFEKSPIKILYIDAKNGSIKYASKAAINFYGYDKSEILTKTIFDLEVYTEPPIYKVGMEYTRDDSISIHQLANGDKRVVQIQTTPISTSFNICNFYFLIIWDVTNHQKRIENINKEKKILEISPILIASFSLVKDWKILQISNNVEKILGYSVDEILFNDFSFKTLLYEDDILIVLRDIRHRSKLLGTPYETDSEFDKACRLKTNSGKYEWFKIFIKVSKEKDENIVTVFMFNNTQQKTMEDVYKEKLSQYKNITSSSSAMSWAFDCKKEIYSFSGDFLSLLGYSNDDIKIISLAKFSKLIHPEYLEKFLKVQNDYIDGKANKMSIKTKFITKNGKNRWILLTLKHLNRNPYDELESISGTLEDVTNNIENEPLLRLISNIYLHSKEGIMITDLESNILDVNASFTSITGYTKNEVIGRNVGILKSGTHNIDFYKDMWKDIKENGFWHGEILNKKKNGQIFTQSITITSIKDEDEDIKNYIGIFSDITKVKENESRLEEITHFDPLTKLPNRFYLLRHLKNVMKEVRNIKKTIAVVCFDLDGFKHTSDTYGYYFNDNILIKISNRIKRILDKEDLLARFSENEFVAVISNVNSLDKLFGTLNEILQSVTDKLVINDNQINLSMSIGVSLYPQISNIQSNELLRQADWAMYYAKFFGKNKFYIFDEKKDIFFDKSRTNLFYVDKFNKEEFIHMYQPVVSVRTGKITSFEVLIRWQHPSEGVILPLDFLYLFKNKIWFNDFTIWVIQTAFRDMLNWNFKDIKVTINVSINQLMDDKFYDAFKILCEQSKFNLNLLHLEIMDIRVVEFLDYEMAKLTRYTKLGVELILDDFGTSLSLLKIIDKIPSNIYKTDKIYATDLLKDIENINALEGILHICDAFNKIPIAKGVENAYIYTILADLGFEELQGNFINKPLPREEVFYLLNGIDINIVKIPNTKRIPYYKFIIFQISSIAHLTNFIQDKNLELFDYKNYKESYENYSSKLSFIPAASKELHEIITEIFIDENIKSKDKLNEILDELEYKKLNIIKSINGE